MRGAPRALTPGFVARSRFDPLQSKSRFTAESNMALDYTTHPTFAQKWRRLLQNWRLLSFFGVCFLVFGYFGYTIIGESLSSGIHKEGNYNVVNLKALGQFVFDSATGVDTDVPSVYRALDGKKVQLQGFMVVTNSAAAQVSNCQLVWNVQKCCFGGPPMVQERVFLHTPPYKKMNRYDQYTFVTVTGTLHVKIQKDPVAGVISVYDMTLDNVTPNS